VQAFDLAPTLVPKNPNSINYPSCKQNVCNYRESRDLNTFSHLCQLNYVGHGKVDVALNTQELCNKISSLRQFLLLGGHRRTDNPKELFDKFSHLSFSLPDDTTT